MKLTNKLGLPEAVVKAVERDPYTRGASDISVTQLIAPPRQVALSEKHRDELEEDVSDRLWSLFGQIGHGLLEQAGQKTAALTEERLFLERLGWTVSGQFDNMCLERDILTDFKFTTVWKIIREHPVDWEQQLNLLAHLLRVTRNISVRSVRVIALLRDWSKPEARRNADYPQAQVAVLDFPVWTASKCETFLLDRLSLHQAARSGNLPECTAEERWEKPSTYAIRKIGNKKAMTGGAKFPSEQEALAWAASRNLTDGSGQLKSDHELLFREGEPTRCLSYCTAAPFCEQWRADPRNLKAQFDEL